MHSPCPTASRLHRAMPVFRSVAAPQSIKKCGSCCSMFTLPPPAPAITLLCTSCMPLVRARVFRGPPSVQHHRQPCSCASRKSVVIVKYPALAPRVLALHDRTAKSSISFPHDVHACAKRRTHPRRRRHDVAGSSPQVCSALQRSSAQ